METLENKFQKRLQVSLYPLLFLVTLLGLSVLLEGCTDSCEVTNEYVYYEPVYTTIDQVRASVELVAPQKINSVGKIYFKDNIIFLNQPGEGVHLINNEDPSHPTQLSFLKIPGNFDIAIKGNTLYADSFVDLIAFDVSDISNIHEVNRVEGVFKNYQVLNYSTAPTNCCVITNWEQKNTINITESDCGASAIQPWGGRYYMEGIAFSASAFTSDASVKAAIAPGTGSGPGVGGSLARFTITANHLYLLDGGDLKTVNIADAQNPVEKNTTFLAWDIETIFPYETSLFVGSSSGMHIIDVTSPEAPQRISTYQHLRSCDPVVVEDDYAYVTLRSGTTCQGFTNQLEVINIENPSSPILVKTYPMTNPHGLGIDNKTLFICDGEDGLKTFDATDVMAISDNLIAHYKEINALDVIPYNSLLIMIGEDGLFQFDYSDPQNITLLSKISIGNE
jgi:hypothetical protein